MKKIVRMIVFSAVSLYLTSLIIKGFVLKTEVKSFLLATVILAFAYYIINNFLVKLVLFPFNVVTLGLMSLIISILLMNYVINKFHFVTIKSWVFDGFQYNGFSLPKMRFSYWETVIASSLSYTTIINLLGKLL